jgi:hypothetical protein
MITNRANPSSLRIIQLLLLLLHVRSVTKAVALIGPREGTPSVPDPALTNSSNNSSNNNNHNNNQH